MKSLFPVLRQDRIFTLYQIFQQPSNMCSWVQIVAMGLIVHELTGSAVSLGVSLLLGSIPQAILGLWGGVIADHYPRRTVMLVTQFQMLLLAAVMSVLVGFQVVPVWSLYVSIALTSVLRAFNQGAQRGYVGEMLVGWKNPDQEDAPNSGCKEPSWEDALASDDKEPNRKDALTFDAKASQVTWVLASALTGLFASQGDWFWVFVLNAASFVPILWLIWRGPYGREYPVARNEERLTLLGMWQQIKSLVDAVEHLKDSAARELTLFCVTTFALGTVGASMPVIVQEMHGGKAYTVLYAAQAVGSLLACFAMRWFRQGSGWLLFCGASAVYGLVLPMWWEALAVIALFLLLDVTTMRTKVFLQHKTPDALCGRVSSVYALINTGGWGVSGWIAGMLIPEVGVTATELGGAALGALGVGIVRLKFGPRERDAK
ncbi:MFS transporter [Ktedonospora formicarum]|uniref:MFS transporter n=1 Tax=Ktedonospora formicarum TaxID=2778364 RepID=A0A8J3I6E1_9CHLR|nr:MFS transporter [Ktedonospora formicarum]